MKTIAMTVLSIFTSLAVTPFSPPASASEESTVKAKSTLTCTSTTVPSMKAELKFDASDLLEDVSISVHGSKSAILSATNAADFDILEHFVTTSDVKNFGLLQQLEFYAREGSTAVAELKVQTVSLKDGSSAELLDLATAIEQIGDDLAGIVMMTVTEPSGSLVGSSVVIGWGGYFNNCK